MDIPFPIRPRAKYYVRANSTDRYLAIKQDGCSVAEYIVDKEDLENTLGDQISQPIKETSFRRGLNGWIKDELIAFNDLSFKRYKDKVEFIDQDA